MKTRIVPILITLLCAAIASVQSARAATITVTNTNDSGAGSLRGALAVANDGDTVDATGVSGTILLTSGELQITHNVTINGPGAGNLAVNGNASFPVFENFFSDVTISGFTITNGASGGILTGPGTLTMNNCTISGNSGGGINIDGGNNGTLTMNNCTISDNSGPGIFNYAGTLTVSNCTISGNSADSGGGIFNLGGMALGGTSTATVSNCTISGNSADSGGGISNVAADLGEGAAATVTVSNSTVSGNSAANGGGIYNTTGGFGFAGVSVNKSTVSGNSATGNGGGIYNRHEGQLSSTELDLGNTILSAGVSGGTIFNDGGQVTSLGYNLANDAGGGVLTGPGDQINTDPMLGPLQDNGGPTFTHALLPGSPAFNAGDPNFTPPPLYDQRGRGFKRVVNGRIDIGSFEVQVRPTIRR